MAGWIKYFKDGTKETGDDSLVEQGKASWRKGRLEGLSGALLYDGEVRLLIEGSGEFWQSDEYEVSFFSSKPRRTKRRIQMQITPRDQMMHTSLLKTGGSVIFSPLCEKYHHVAEDKKRLPPDYIGKWFTIELDITSGGITTSFKDHKI